MKPTTATMMSAMHRALATVSRCRMAVLRCVQLGISIRDLDLLTIGMVNDMYAESSNDSADYSIIAGQDEFDLF